MEHVLQIGAPIALFIVLKFGAGQTLLLHLGLVETFRTAETMPVAVGRGSIGLSSLTAVSSENPKPWVLPPPSNSLH